MKNFLKLYPDYEKRVYGLDILRAIAILLVVLLHADGFLEKTGTTFPWIPLPDGVELFFVLSGFLIGSILIRTLENTDRFSFSTIYGFLKRRWFRTLPNYYLVLLLNVLVVSTGLIKEDIHQFNWKFFFFLQNFYSGFYGFFWESWSLSIEEWFYLLFPFTVILFYFLFRTVRKKNIFLLAILTFMVVPITLRVFLASKMKVDSFWLGVNIWKVVMFRLDSIAFGILAAVIKFYHPKSFYRFKTLLFIAGIVFIYSVQFVEINPDSFFYKTFIVSFISIGCALLLPMFDSIKKGPIPAVKIVTHISLISYSMYLINLSLVASVLGHYFPPQTVAMAYVTYGIYWVLVILLSTLLYKYYEKPMMDLRDRRNS